MNKLLATIFSLTAIVLTSSQLFAQCDACGTMQCCPACVGKAEVVDVEKHCWEIECEEICIPAVRFPWEPGGNKITIGTLFDFKCGGKGPGCTSGNCDDLATCDGAPGGCCSSGHCEDCGPACCPPKPGFIVAVRDLKKKTYEVKACEYSMERVDSSASPGCCSAGGCDACAAKTKSPSSTLPRQQVAAKTAPLPKANAVSNQGEEKAKPSWSTKLVSLKSRLFTR